MNAECEALYFPSKGQRLFGMFYPAQARDEGIVICPPAPQETMRSHSAHVQLGRKLQQMGYAVFRFDYAGTGDSEGAIRNLGEWRANITSAVAQLKRLSGVAKISLLGTRLGGALALQASQQIGVKRIVLWDPICDGKELISAYREAHRLMLNRVPVEAPYPRNQSDAEQLCGFAFPKNFEEDLAAIDVETLLSPCRRISLVHHSSSTPWQQLSERWRQEGAKVDEILTEEQIHWAHDILMRRQAFPSLSLKALAQAFEGP